MNSNRLIIWLSIFLLSFFTSYSQVNTEKHTYFISPEFTQGTVFMKTGAENDALLNYNSLTKEMIFKNKSVELSLIKEQVDSVLIDDRKFVILNNEFFELVHQSKVNLYVEHKCDLIAPSAEGGFGTKSQNLANYHFSNFINKGNNLSLELPDGYKTKPYRYYWLERNGKLNKFTNIRQLRKLFSDKKKTYKAYLKKYDVSYKDQKSMIQLIKHLETN